MMGRPKPWNLAIFYYAKFGFPIVFLKGGHIQLPSPLIRNKGKTSEVRLKSSYFFGFAGKTQIWRIFTLGLAVKPIKHFGIPA